MSTVTSPSSASKTAVFALGGAALVGVGLAAGMWLNRPASPAVEPVTASPAAAVAVASASSAAQLASAPVTQSAAAPTSTTEAAPPATAAPAAEAKPTVRKTAKPKPHTDAPTAQAPSPAKTPAPVCATCGTVDHVRTIQKEAASTGVGAVAGGVLGGVIGNQLGKGQGKTAMTILGAIGGGVAGNEIEKKQRAETMYEITVRMDDGTTRTLTQSTAPSVGSRVEVAGQQLKSLE